MVLKGRVRLMSTSLIQYCSLFAIVVSERCPAVRPTLVRGRQHGICECGLTLQRYINFNERPLQLHLFQSGGVRIHVSEHPSLGVIKDLSFSSIA
jgi:hypothetical protein